MDYETYKRGIKCINLYRSGGKVTFVYDKDCLDSRDELYFLRLNALKLYGGLIHYLWEEE